MLLVILLMIFILQSSYVTAETGKGSLSFAGDGYFVELTYDADSLIPEDAYLKVAELQEGSKEYQQYFSQTEEFVSQETEQVLLDARFFDVCIMDGENEIEPDDSVRVSVSYQEGMPKREGEQLSVVHFVEDGTREFLDVEVESTEGNEVTEIIFEQESFSVIGTIIFNGADTSLKSADSEIISGSPEINVEKEWSDGEDVHADDAVEITLYDVTTGSAEVCDRLTLDSSTEWKGKFENLDEEKKYCIKETKVTAGDMEETVSYKSTITNSDIKKWCPVEDNQLQDGQEVLLIVGDTTRRMMRKSSAYEQMNLKLHNVAVQNDSTYGLYCTTEILNIFIWDVIWDEENNGWELYSESGNAYLALLYNAEEDCYEWATSREKTEGACLTYADGTFCATVDGVTKYLGNVTLQGPYEGLDEGDEGIQEFQIYSYKIFEPASCHILNEKNVEMAETEISADVVTSKTIDYLGDGEDNPDTDLDNGKVAEQILKDLYRLTLAVNMKTDATGLDLLLVIDVSSSMKGNQDAKDAEGNAIYRAEALRQALNQFVPSFLPEGTRNNLSIVAFESDSIILQEWTKDSDAILEKVNYEADGEMPLYNGEGTNYESALIRAHESLMMCGYSGNPKAMMFLSDGHPTVYYKWNDELENGNVTVDLGEASLSENGIDVSATANQDPSWQVETGEAAAAADEAIASFKRHNPDVMVGTIAFHTVITDSLKNLATDSRFVTQIENGTPDDLIEAMELITEFVPREIVVVDELSENVDLYSDYPDIRVNLTDDEGTDSLLYTSEEGLTEEGKEILNNDTPIETDGKIIKMRFQEDYQVENNSTYLLAFNVMASQKAFDKFADGKGKYSDEGDENTDFEGNDTSSLKEGYYSNGDSTKVQYTMNGAQMEKKYRKPVIQVREGTMMVLKTDMEGNVLADGAEFALYRKADEGEDGIEKLTGLDGTYIKAAVGETDENGEVLFEHLRLAVFDAGYPYYLVETKAPEGYARNKAVTEFLLYEDHVELRQENEKISTGQIEVSESEMIGLITVRNPEETEIEFEIPVTGGKGNYIFYLTGLLLIAGGIMMGKKKLSKFMILCMAVIMTVQMLSVTVLAIDSTDKGQITVNGVESGVNVSVYRLMDISFDYDVQQPKNPMYQWVTEVADWVSANYPAYIDTSNLNAVQEAFSETEEVKTAEFYDKLVVAIKDGTVELSSETVEAAGESVTVENLTMGNYFILIEGGAKVYRPLTANVVPEWKDTIWQMSTPQVQAKASEPTITKTVSGGLTEDNAAIGDTISYELNAVVPVYPENATAKRYVVSDRLSDGFTLSEDSIKVYGVNTGKEDELLTNGYTKAVERPVDVEDKNVSFALEFDYDAIKAYESVKITYDAVINENVVVGGAGNENNVFLDYNNNPYVSESWNTDQDSTVVYTYGMKITKTDEDTNQGLAGAEFTLTKENAEIAFVGGNGEYHVAGTEESGDTIVTVDDNGNLTLDGLDVGTYFVTEVKAPDGYVKLQNPVEIVITDADVNGKVEADGQELEDGYMPVTVKNDQGFTLPVTGGMGTTIFNIAGITLMGAGILLFIICSIRKKPE